MSKFRCKCLNLTVHVKEKATREANGKAFVAETCTAAFFDQELFEVELAVGGITKVNISLVVYNQKHFGASSKTKPRRFGALFAFHSFGLFRPEPYLAFFLFILLH